MADLFKPASPEEELSDVVEALRVDIQFAIQHAMKKLNISQKQLAEKIGCSAGNVSQMLREDANLTVESVGRTFWALGIQPKFTTDILDQDQEMDEEIQETPHHLFSSVVIGVRGEIERFRSEYSAKWEDDMINASARPFLPATSVEANRKIWQGGAIATPNVFEYRNRQKEPA